MAGIATCALTKPFAQTSFALRGVFPMKVAVVRGAALNQWEMQSFEALPSEFQLTACGAIAGEYPCESIRLPRRSFARKSDVFDRLGPIGKVGRRLGVLSRPEEFLIGLEDYLADFDIVHAAELHMTTSLQAVRAAQQHGLRSVITCWETIPFAYEENSKVLRERRAMVRAEADLFLATTQRAAQALRIEGVASERIQVVMPGVDTGRFQPAPKSPAMLKKLNLVGDELVVMTISRIIREKGIRELVLGFRHALTKLPETVASRCRLLIAGRGPQKSYIEALIAQLGLKQSVRIVGTCDYLEIHRLHQIADVFALPSVATPYWEEQYGMVLAEAMACGKAVISTTTGGIPEVLGDTGLLLPPLESERLGETLACLLNDPEKRAVYGKKARARAVSYLSVSHFASQLAAVYRELCPSHTAQVSQAEFSTKLA